MTKHEQKEEKHEKNVEKSVETNVNCKPRDKESKNDKPKEKYELDETKKKLDENLETKKEKCLMKLFCKSFKKEKPNLGTEMGKHEVITCTTNGPDETNKRKLKVEEEMTNKKSKITLDETIAKEGTTNEETTKERTTNEETTKKGTTKEGTTKKGTTKEGTTKQDIENADEKGNIPNRECVKDQEKQKTIKEQSGMESNKNGKAEKEEKEIVVIQKKTEKIETTENSKIKNNNNKESTENTNVASVDITNLKPIEENKTVENLKEENAIVSIKTNMNENFKLKENGKAYKGYENGKNEEQEKYQKALIYNNNDHKYTRSHFVSFSNKYKDGSIRLSDDQLTCYGDKGWASVFLNCGADDGKWYFEITVESSITDLNFLGYTEKKLKINSCLRVGYACRYMRYDHPIGTSKYSYCVNSKDGKMFNSSISYDCMKAFSKGDVIGCYMNLKKKTDYKFDPRLDKKLYEYIQNGILSDPQNPPELKKSEGSLIFFALNGEIKENAFVDIYDGFYHPSVSLYMGASARINLGPNFKYNHLKDYVPCMYMHQPIVS